METTRKKINIYSHLRWLTLGGNVVAGSLVALRTQHTKKKPTSESAEHVARVSHSRNVTFVVALKNFKRRLYIDDVLQRVFKSRLTFGSTKPSTNAPHYTAHSGM